MHDTAAMLIELGAIILALGLLGRLAGRMGFSPIPLYLLAGLAFGHGGLLPLQASEEFTATGARSASSCCCFCSAWSTAPLNSSPI